MPLDKDDYRVHWVASDCSTCIAGITDAGVLETLGGLNIDVDFATGEPIVVDIDVPLASDVFVTGIDVDLQQSAGYTDSWSTAGGIIGIRGDVHVDYVITNAYGVFGNLYIDPAATCTVNDGFGVYGNVLLVGAFTAGAATSEIAALKGIVAAGCSGSYDGRVYGLGLEYNSTVNYDGVTALVFGVTAAGAYCDYGLYILNASPNMTAGILIDDSGVGSIVTGIAVSATCTTAALQIGIGGTAAGDVYFYSGEAADNYFRYNSSTGKFVFGGITDWGTGATGVLIDGAGYDWVSQTVGHIDANLNNTAAAAAYYALTVGASQTGSNSCFGTWTELYISNSVDLTGADNFAAVWGQVEAGTGVTFSDTGCFTAGVYSNVIAGATLTVAAGHSLNGVRAQIEVAAITNAGKSAAFECLKNGGVDWDYGIYLADVTTGIYSEGKMVFGGVTDWGTGATGTQITGDGYDWVSQTVGRVNTDINNTAAAAAYHALTVTVSQANSNSFFGTWTELYLSNSVDLTGADNAAAVWGQVEAGTGVTLSDTGCFTAGGYFNVKAGATLTLVTGHTLNGVRAQLEVAAISTTGTARTAAFECLKNGGVDWDYGLYIADAAVGVEIGDSTTGINIDGTITTGLNMEPSAMTKAIAVGAESFAASGLGLPLNGVTTHEGVSFYFDDGGVKLAAGYTEALRAGFLVSTEITVADVSLYTAHDYVYLAEDVTTAGGVGATWGSMLVKAGVTITTSSGVCDFSGAHFTCDVPATAVIGTGTWACGVSVGGNLGGTHTGNAAGYRVRVPGAGKWDVGLRVEPTACVEAIQVGTASYALSGSGIPLDGVTQHSGAEIYFDDGGVKLAAGYTEAFLMGFLVSTAVTDAAVSCSTSHDYMYLAADVETSGTFSGGWSSILVKTGVTITASGSVTDFPAHHFSVDVPAGATIAASTFACGLSIGGQLGGTHTGKAVGFRLRPANGNWDGLCDITSQVTGGANGGGADVYIDCFIDGVAARITAKMVT